MSKNSTANRLARLRTCSDGTLPRKDYKRLFSGVKRCTYCDRGLSWESLPARADDAATIDHMMPLVRGGRHSLLNVVVCCLACNRDKANWTIEEWKWMLPANRRARLDAVAPSLPTPPVAPPPTQHR